MKIYTGIGYDIHRFKKGRKLILGGIEIKGYEGLEGHSDADVIIHSISDAILGALSAGDIGHYFPSSEKKFKNISSILILKKVFSICKQYKYKILNTDITVITQKPKISLYREKMQKVISSILKTDRVNIKATTNEGIGIIGKGKGIACFTVVTLAKK